MPCCHDNHNTVIELAMQRRAAFSWAGQKAMRSLRSSSLRSPDALHLSSNYYNNNYFVYACEGSSPYVHSTCTSYVLCAYLYCVYALAGGAISIRDRISVPFHESVPKNRTLSSTGPLSVH